MSVKNVAFYKETDFLLVKSGRLTLEDLTEVSDPKVDICIP